MRWVLIALSLLVAGPALAASHGNQSANSGSSSVGMNISGGSYAPNLPFLNYFKLNQQWGTRTASIGDTHEEPYLYANGLDANGYPTKLTGLPTGTFNATFNGTTTMVVNSLTSGVTPWLGGTLNVVGSPTVTACPGGVCGGTGSYTISATVASATSSVIETATYTQVATASIISTTTLTGAPFYPSGSYLFKWDGSDCGGSTCFEYHNDLTFSSHSCAGGTCTDVITAVPSSGGMRVFETAMGATPPTNFRLVNTAQYNALTTAQKAAFDAGGCSPGACLNPDWVAQVKQFRGFRYMNPMNVINNTNTSWANRQPLNWESWIDVIKYQSEIPIEVAVDISNELNANAWFSMPCLADTTYYTNFATLVLSTLNANLSVISEACNEPWNFGASSTVTNLMIAAGSALFPSCASIGCSFDYANYRAAINADTWKSIWTGANAARLTTVFGSSIGDPLGYGSTYLNMVATKDGGSAGLFTGHVYDHVDAYADAPYFSCSYTCFISNSFTANNDGGIAKLYQMINSGGVNPATVVAGNCGNGAGKTCGGPVHYTLTSGLSLPSTPANQTCLAFTLNTDSSVGADLAVDGGTAFPIQGTNGVAISGSLGHTLITTNPSFGPNYAVCFTSAVAKVATGVTLGSGGSGYTNGFPILTTLGGICNPQPTFQVTVSGNAVQASGITINTPGFCPLAPANPVSVTGGGGTGATLNLTYPTLTPGWQLTQMQASCGSEFACTLSEMSLALGVIAATGKSLKYIGYEGGQALLDGGCFAFQPICDASIPGNPPVDGLLTAMSYSPLMGQLYETWFETVRAGGMTELYALSDAGPWIGGQAYWGFNPGIYAAGIPTSKQAAIYDYIRRNPCWWSNCRH